MKNLVVLGAAFAMFSCTQDNSNIERKLDQILAKLDKGGRPGGAERPTHDPKKVYSVPVDNDPFIGPADALVTVVKAYDYACPYCEKVRPTMDELIAKYGNDVRIVYKQLVVHPRNAMAGALAFCAAAKQGKVKEMDQLIWDKGFKAKQMDLSDVPVDKGAAPGQGNPEVAQAQKCWDTPDGCKNVVGYAQELQLDVERFKADMRGCVQNVQNDMKTMQALSVSATPAFFVNGRNIAGAAPTETFTKLIDEELAKAKEEVAKGMPRAEYYQRMVVEKGAKSI